jgi:DNA-binding CsgD family transcriptional regulator/tetratricopeptide (TPR) repeat protein
MARGTEGPLAEAFARSGGERDAVFEALYQELARRVTVLVVEDVHWADEGTLDVLRLLVRRVQALPTLAVITFRDYPLPDEHPLTSMLGAATGPGVFRLPLRLLSRAAVATLAAGRSVSVEDLYAATGGNPFFVTELLEAPDTRVPATVRDAVLARARVTTPSTQRVMRVLSVVPAQVELPLVALLAGDNEALAAVAEAERHGCMMVTGAGAVGFRHELFRRAVEHTLTSAERLDAHRQVLAGLTRLGADASRLVHHAVSAGDVDALLEHAPVAARAAAQAGSYQQAAALWGQVLAHADRLSTRELAEATGECAYAFYVRQRFAEGAELAERSAALWDQLGEPLRHGEVLSVLSYNRYWSARTGPAREAARQAIAVLEPLGPTPQLAVAYGALAGVLMQADDEESVEWSERALALARRLGRTDLEANALNYLGTMTMAAGDPEGERLLARGLELAADSRHHVYAVRICANLARLLLRSHRPLAAVPVLARGLSHAQEQEFQHGTYRLRALQAGVALQCGRWDEAETGLRELLRSERDPGVSGGWVLSMLGRLLLRRGSFDEAGELLDQAWALALVTGEPARVVDAGVGLVEQAWLCGDPEQAAARAVEPLAAVGDSRALVHGRAELLTYLARAGHAQPADAGCPQPFADELAGRWDEAARQWQERGNPYEQALALAGSGDETAMVQALSILDTLGAGPAAQLVRRRLRSLGVVRLPRGPVPQTRANPAGLTERQVDVLTELARGLTNAEIADRLVVSVRTVDHHVSAVLGKLGVSSRREAAATARALGLLDDGQPPGAR